MSIEEKRRHLETCRKAMKDREEEEARQLEELEATLRQQEFALAEVGFACNDYMEQLEAEITLEEQQADDEDSMPAQLEK